jgi:hypothetical protein
LSLPRRQEAAKPLLELSCSVLAVRVFQLSFAVKRSFNEALASVGFLTYAGLMVIRVIWQRLETPTLEGSPHPVEMYYEVEVMPNRWAVLRHLALLVKDLDLDRITVEETDLDAAELRRQGVSVHRILF